MNIRKIATKVGRGFKNSSPTILTWLGAGGVIATAILAVRATPKAMDVIENEYNNRWELNVNVGDFHKPDPLTRVDIVKTVWPLYIPSILVGASTITCIFGANVLNKKQQASIASMYAMLDQSYKRYKQATNEVYGDDADLNIKAQAARSVYISDDGHKIYDPDLDEASEKVLFYEEYSGRYFTSTVAAVINAIYHINRNWSLKGEVSVNELYSFLGIDGIDGWDNIGWSYEYAEEGQMWLDFDMTKVNLEDGLQCFIFSPRLQPTDLFFKVYPDR